jgi:pyruvate/2-oxoglutarate dehydrogenase complex dihydrolipoamide dehydrogenase (E3) component
MAHTTRSSSELASPAQEWLAADGKRVALIEMDRAGGTCLNHGCKPTKALRASSTVAHQARRGPQPMA